jgi:hypothetical protein
MEAFAGVALLVIVAAAVVLIAFGMLVNMVREMLAEVKALRADLQPSPLQLPSVQQPSVQPPPVRQPPRQPVSTPDAMEREIGAAFRREKVPRSSPRSPQVEGKQS